VYHTRTLWGTKAIEIRNAKTCISYLKKYGGCVTQCKYLFLCSEIVVFFRLSIMQSPSIHCGHDQEYFFLLLQLTLPLWNIKGCRTIWSCSWVVTNDVRIVSLPPECYAFLVLFFAHLDSCEFCAEWKEFTNSINMQFSFSWIYTSEICLGALHIPFTAYTCER